MRRLRFVPQGALVEITAKTVQGRLLLRPDPRTNDLILGVVGRAQRLYGMSIVGFVFLSNHFHLLIYPGSAQQMARFMAYVLSNVAREVGNAHDWRDKFWARRYVAVVASDEAETQCARLRYLLSQGVKEGLVAAPLDWPGAHCVEALTAGRALQGTWYDRTAEFLARRMGLDVSESDFSTTETTALTPLACWAALPDEQRRALVAALVAAIEREGRSERGSRLPMGPAAVRAQRPHERPLSHNRSSCPDFHAASRAARMHLRAAYRRFVAAFRHAADQLRAGALDAVFPSGSFPPSLPYVAVEPSG